MSLFSTVTIILVCKCFCNFQLFFTERLRPEAAERIRSGAPPSANAITANLGQAHFSDPNKSDQFRSRLRWLRTERSSRKHHRRGKDNLLAKLSGSVTIRIKPTYYCSFSMNMKNWIFEIYLHIWCLSILRTVQKNNSTNVSRLQNTQ